MDFRHRNKVTNALETVSLPVRRIWPRLPEAVIGLFCLLFIIFCGLTYSSSISIFTSRLINGNKYLALFEGMLNPFRNKHLLLKSGLPIYDLKISHTQYMVIEGIVEQAKKQGWMSDDLKVWADAQFIHNGETYNVKVRVRGDLPRHWEEPKKSWRIKFGKKQIEENGKVRKEPIYFQGKRQINLIVPIDREFILAKFVNDLMRERGLVTARDGFAILRLNGVLQGLYYEVEHFDKPLLASQRRPETTVFAQNDRAMHFEQYTKYGTPIASDANLDIGTLRHLVDENGELGARAMNVLFTHSLNPTDENFRHARAVMDWEKYLTFRAMTTLCNTNHVRFGTDNLRLFYDSSRGLLEPIPWDLHILKLPKEPGTIDFWNSKGPDELQRATLLNPELRLQRNRILWGFIGDGGDSLIARYQKLHDKIRPLAWADVLTTPIQGYKMDEIKKIFEFNVKRTFKVLNNSACDFTYALDSDSSATLEAIVTNFSGIKLKQIRVADSLVFEGAYQLYEDGNNNGVFDKDDQLVQETIAQNGSIAFNFDKYILPDVKYDGDTIDGTYWEYFDTISKRSRFFLVGKLTPENRHPIEWTPPDIKVTAFNAVTDHPIPSAFISQDEPLPDNYMGITAYDCSDPFDLDAPEYTLAQFLKAHPEFVASQTNPGAVELRGKVEISRTVLIPKSVSLIINKGTDITMMPAANILCYGGLRAVGTAQERIRIHGNKSGKAWGVIGVVRPQQAVILQYADIQDGGQAQINGILFTGGFAVHDGDLELADCSFSEMQSEDGINLKNGDIQMLNCLFSDNASDGIDIDFGTGKVMDSKFINIHGDGLDLSGSEIMISGCWFENVADKGISVGEDSHPIVFNNLFRNCDIGISTKDLSFAKIAHCTFVDNRMAIEAKRKKPMFGAGSGQVLNSVFSGNEILLSEDFFSKGKVSVSNSIVDQQVDWPSTKTITVRFTAPEQNNFTLDPSIIANNGFSLASPEWMHPYLTDAALIPGVITVNNYR